MKLFSLLTGELAGGSSALRRTGKKEPSPFWEFLFHTKTNKQYLQISAVCTILEFVIFKLLYPYPDFISDSYSYIESNLYHMDVNLWPIGYSNFLWLIHSITPSDTFLVFFQYLLLEISLLYFFFSILYFYGLSKKHTDILFVFLFFNPIFLFLSNCVLSDSLFCSLSLVLFTQYLWMYHRPKISNVIFQALLIGLAFTIRYTAIYYPIVSALALILAKYRTPVKLIGAASPWLLIIPFIIYTQQKTKQVTGTAEFSVFGGWQIANNALYMYDHIEVDSSKLPKETVELDKMVKAYFKINPPADGLLSAFPGTYFIKNPYAVLKPYMLRKCKITTPPTQFSSWGNVSPIYNKYGSYLISHYPLPFAKYYLWLNAKNYFIPHLEKFGSYNLKMDSVYEPAREWFQFKDRSITSIPTGEFQSTLFFFYPPFFMMLNLYFIGCFFYLLFSRRLKNTPRPLMVSFILTIGFLFINFCFSVFATPVVLRYQIIPMILLFSFSLYLTEMFDQPNPSVKASK